MLRKIVFISTAILLSALHVQAKTHTETVFDDYTVSFDISDDAAVKIENASVEIKAISITSAGNKDGIVLMIMKPDTPQMMTLPMLKAATENNGVRMLADAEEKSITVQELKRGEVCGYYYVITDKAPKPDEYKYLFSGIFMSGEILIQVRYVYNGKKDDTKKITDLVSKMKIEKKPDSKNKKETVK
jgi:hypothetical protein